MSVEAPVYFRDVVGDNQPEGFTEIQRKYVVGPDADATEVQQEIEAWLAENGLEPTSFLMTRPAENAKAVASTSLDDAASCSGARERPGHGMAWRRIGNHRAITIPPA